MRDRLAWPALGGEGWPEIEWIGEPIRLKGRVRWSHFEEGVPNKQGGRGERVAPLHRLRRVAASCRWAEVCVGRLPMGRGVCCPLA